MDQNGKLTELRKTIDEADRKIAALFEARMKAVHEVAEYKLQHSLPVLDTGREEAILRRNAEYIRDGELLPYYLSLQKNMMEISRRYQHSLLEGELIAYAGVEGAFAHIAAKAIFPDGRYMSYPGFEEAYRAVEDGICNACVLPIENSYAGEVGQVSDLLFSGSLKLSGIYELQIHQHLLALPGTRLRDIKSVVSHPQALSQCDGYIKRHAFERITEANTAMAAKRVAEAGRHDIAAIASRDTAELYGLEVIDRGINESGGNTTRFAVLTQSENRNLPKDGAKFIMIFTVNNTPGSLAKAVNVIADFGYNMKALRSRPVKETPWQYYFYVEVEGDPYDGRGEKMLAALKCHCDTIKIVGAYSGEKKLDCEDGTQAPIE